jgi:peptidoglycan/xylan/chitin deacetylase (PgdA/CDA1 family)
MTHRRAARTARPTAGYSLALMALDRGAFVLSLDFELIWGTLDKRGPEGFKAACERERFEVFEPFLGLLEEFEIPATWCVLGHLMLDSCAPVDGVKHPEIVRPTHAWHQDDWFVHDPCSDERRAPSFYGRSLVKRLLAAQVPQEIGCHSFSHVIFGDPGCSRETAVSEIRACLRAAAGLGVTPRSFAFPRNRVGHLDVLREHGFTCFRGPDPIWYAIGRGKYGRLKRAAHLAGVIGARRPPVVLPRRTKGLIDIPGSTIYFPANGVRRHVPVSRRVRRVLSGVESAARERRIMHLWFHPTNLADETQAMLGGLRTVFADVARRRARHELDTLSMGEVAARELDGELAARGISRPGW